MDAVPTTAPNIDAAASAATATLRTSTPNIDTQTSDDTDTRVRRETALLPCGHCLCWNCFVGCVDADLYFCPNCRHDADLSLRSALIREIPLRPATTLVDLGSAIDWEYDEVRSGADVLAERMFHLTSESCDDSDRSDSQTNCDTEFRFESDQDF